MSDPFHEGEIKIQELTGERHQAVALGHVIGNEIPQGARGFLDQQAFAVVAGADRTGDLWATVMSGQPGFASTDGSGKDLSLKFASEPGHAPQTPPLADVQAGGHLGVLFMELATRRRLRVNGTLKDLSASTLTLSVQEAFPNCPKYIQRRQIAVSGSEADGRKAEAGEVLGEEHFAWIANADTFFVASAYPNGRVDVSHRGGNPSFIERHDGDLRIPDYPGNSMFGTLGNFAVNPRAGLAFIDFDTSRILQLTGDVSLDIVPENAGPVTGGTGRWWQFRPRKWIVSGLGMKFEQSEPELSPFNPEPGATS